VRDGLVVGGLAYLVWRFVVFAPLDGHVGADAWAYWVLNPQAPYTLPNGLYGAFLYSPPMVRAFQPFSLLSWPEFWVVWTLVNIGTAVWLGGRRALFILAFPPVALEIYHGNINILLAAAIALGFRYPATWAFVVLTKVTPGIGLLWFLVRREWRNLAIALGVTAAIVAVSLIVDFNLWGEWISAMRRDAAGQFGGPLAIPLLPRLPVAAAVVIWGARTNRPWTVPVASTIAIPVLWVAVFAILAAAIAIQRPELRPRLATDVDDRASAVAN
jgi:hypothetical protein